jgi:DNA primase
VVFTFDGDAAGQKAALRAFAEDQRFVSQTYVAIEPNGLDPCELRQKSGDVAVRELVSRRVPLFEFAITSTIARFDLTNAVGRVQALRAAAPVVARIKDRALRPEYARRLAGLIGIDVDAARRAVAAASRADGGSAARPGTRGAGAPTSGHQDGSAEPATDGPSAAAPPLPPPDLRDPVVRAERQLLQCVLQAPRSLQAPEFDALGEDAFTAPLHRAVHLAVRACGGLSAAVPGEAWVEQVAGAVPDDVRGYVTSLAVDALPVVGDDGLARLASALQVDIAQRDLVRREAEVHSRMQRLDASGDAVGYMAALREAQVLVERRRALAHPLD